MLIVNGSHVDVIDKEQNKIKVTRAQRELLMNYENANYKHDVEKAFSNSNVLHKNFCIVNDGHVVFSL